MGGLDPATDLMNEQSFPEMKEGFYTILFQSQARGEAEVGRDDRLVEVVDVQHSEPGGVSLGTGGTEGDGVVGGSGPHGTEGGSDQVGVGGTIVVVRIYVYSIRYSGTRCDGKGTVRRYMG